MTSSTLIELKGITKKFRTETLETLALNNISLSIFENEYVAIAGPSGCGKSTLLSILGLLDLPTSGEYYFSGIKTNDLAPDAQAELRNEQFGFVFQSFNLIPGMTAFENVALSLMYRKGISKSEIENAAKTALTRVGMDQRLDHYPTQLSGGQQQRVAIARAIVGNPKIILADEPTGNLDSTNAEMIMSLFNELHNSGVTICMVTHDPRSSEYAKRIISVLDGQVSQKQTSVGSN